MTVPRPHAPSLAHRAAALALVAALSLIRTPVDAQTPFEGEVRQLVTFRFLPGRAPEALRVYREEALPLYEKDSAMRSFRAFREAESPVPLDLVVVSSFDGMAGMDASNAELRRHAEEAGTSIGAVYGRIAAESRDHDDQFVEMLPALGSGDPTTAGLVAFVWYRVQPGRAAAFERALSDDIVDWERTRGTDATTGRFLVSDGWHYLRTLGFDSLGAYQAYWTALRATRGGRALDALTAARREVVVVPVPELSVR